MHPMEDQLQKIKDKFLQTDAGKTKSNAIDIPKIELPKGGGAIQGIDEKFTVNAVNGTAAFSIPLPVAAARGFSPALSLSYNSGSGNGIFGIGWNVSLASIQRKTDKKLPRYVDAEDSDTFLFSEAEDLVPELKKNADGKFSVDQHGNYSIAERNSADGKYSIRAYRPRIEGSFARFERWTDKNSGRIQWRIINKDNVCTLYGWTDNSILSDPDDSKKIFTWFPEFSFDDKGNCMQYIYLKEDAVGLDLLAAHNRNRIKEGALSYANLYLSKVLYGNTTPYKKFGDAFPDETDYMFQTVLDYGTTNPEEQSPDVLKTWDTRTDAFSNYKPGFEIRTTRRCNRVLLFHVFDELAVLDDASDKKTLVRSLDLTYSSSSEDALTFLEKASISGYIKKQDGTYSRKQLPAMEFAYQQHAWSKEVMQVSGEAITHAPSGIDIAPYQFVDLYNEGLNGILTEQAGAWYYKRNLGVWGNADTPGPFFEQAKPVSPKPSFSGLGDQLQLSDLDADGGKQLVRFAEDVPGYFELDAAENWQPMRTFTALPNIDHGDPNMRMLDLNGDGKAEIIISEENVFTWYASEGREGFSAAVQTIKPFDEERGAQLLFAEAKQSIFLADMSGDGMTDIVRIRNGEVCYWPNMGYGKFGAKVTMDHAPVFDHPEAFNPAYIRLSDINGSGTTDIIYLGKQSFSCWQNNSGNRFSTEPFVIDMFPEIHKDAQISVTDLLGNGVACIVWSSPLEKDKEAPLKYIDLMQSRKPHVLVSYKNNTGKEVYWEYTPSTKFYIEDKLAGNPWVTKLHFPVHCVSKVRTEDIISGYTFIKTYSYHHGYYDHAEREFRGFGMVEETDAETFAHWVKQNAGNITEEPLHQEPVVTRSWFHTGANTSTDDLLQAYEQDHWYHVYAKTFGAIAHPEKALPAARIIFPEAADAEISEQLSVDVWRESLRACKGMALRTEIFARDAAHHGNTEEAQKKEMLPYSVATNNCLIELLQPKGNNAHAVFIVKESESITYQYEREPDDARIAHHLNIQVDIYGNILESASIVYPRAAADATLPEETQAQQNSTHIVYTQNAFTHDVISEDIYRLRLPSEVMTYAIKGVTKSGTYYAIEDLKDILSDTRSEEVMYQEQDKALPSGKAQRRLIEHVRTTYCSNDLKNALPLHQLESHAFTYESYQLAYTPTLVDHIFGIKVSDAVLTEGKFVHQEGDAHWWIRSGTTERLAKGETISNAQNRFFLPIAFTDAFGATTKVKYAEPHFLYIRETEDVLGNTQRVDVFNFRTLSPARMQDINGNFSAAIKDALGMIKAIALFGKGEEADDLIGISEITDAAEEAAIQNFFSAADSTQLRSAAKALLKNATHRYLCDLHAYQTAGKSLSMATISREEHAQIHADSPFLTGFEYSNGMGEVVMKKVQAEPGVAKQVVVHADNTISVQEVDTSASDPKLLRWIGNGRTIKNNKGNPVKQYEPYFSTSWKYEDHKELVETGVTPKIYYDAAGRVVKTEMPDGTLTKMVFSAWKQYLYDANDTVSESSWFKDRSERKIDALLLAEGKDPAKEKVAAEKAAKHADTPTTLHFDTLGRPVLYIEHNKRQTDDTDLFSLTKIQLDIEGNLLRVTDARGNNVAQNAYDMLGTLVYQNYMDTGQRWLLANAAGRPLRSWDERNHVFHYFYDAAQRRTQSKVTGGDGDVALDHIFERILYGENLLHANRSNENELRSRNILGQPIQHYDTGGVVETPAYDFKGQPLTTTRRLFKRYKEVVNWTGADPENDLEPGAGYTFSTKTDALGRMKEQITPDGSIILPAYNATGLLREEKVKLSGESAGQIYIKDIRYDEKGRREKVIFGNDVSTKFYYDVKSFRLLRAESKRLNGDALHDWNYTYDAVGNITHIEDKSIPQAFFNNQKITGVSTFTYDALYRLVEAGGRENNAALQFGTCDNWNDAPFMHGLNPGDPMAMRNYTQRYQYDAVGNITEMKHLAANANWTRGYVYAADKNRLLSTVIGDNSDPANYTKYTHHAQHGFLTELPHLEKIAWNFKEEVACTIRQHCTDDNIPVTTYYQYDGSGKRLRKITEDQTSGGGTVVKKEERIYVGGFEIYKKHNGTDAGLERVSLQLQDGGHCFLMIETRNDVDDGTEKKLVRYQLHNHISSAALELDQNAQVISYEEYHPFGSTAFQAMNKAIKCAAKRYRFTGMERDEETGLEYHNARYYIPWLGRWLSADPIGIKDGVNVYIYAANNPVNRSDGNGKQSTPQSVPPPGAIGRVERWVDQVNPRRVFGQIVTEAEHVIPHGSLKSLLWNPLKNSSEYKTADYMRDTTIVWEREAALMKTRIDNIMTKALKGTVVDLGEIAESSFKRTVSAANATGSKVEAEQVMHAVLGQMGNLFSRDRLSDSARKAVAFAEEEAKLIPKPVLAEAAPIAKEAGLLAKVSKASKVLGPIGAVLTVFAIGESVANAAEVNAEDTKMQDDHDLLQDLNQFSANAEPVVLATTLLPGQAGFISGVAQGAYSVATTGIEHTGGEKRIVEAAKGAESVAEYLGASDVTKETVGVVATKCMALASVGRVLGEVSAIPIGWANGKHKAWSN
ncbi:MAG: SpvB/TcaC N-terminal domain-containing protein [Chitinophagales bacterium]